LCFIFKGLQKFGMMVEIMHYSKEAKRRLRLNRPSFHKTGTHDKRTNIAFVIEIKCLKTRTNKERLNQSALSAVSQIKEKGYSEELLRSTIKTFFFLDRLSSKQNGYSVRKSEAM